ncbi:MAG: hypothetical protein J6Y16_07255 [Treponema sp.]|nr:hypothetical protein [Treponema sp.]
MKRRITFLDNEYGTLSTGKFVAFAFDLLLALFSYLGGKEFPMGLTFLFLIFPLSLPINIWFIIRSIKDNTFELLSLYLLPILIAFIIGMFVDSNNSEKAKENLLDAQRYVEQYYELSGSFPGNDDPYLQELGVQIQGRKFMAII